MTKREVFGLLMILVALALTPFAYGASLAFGLVAFLIGIGGLISVVTARPWYSRAADSDDYAEPRKFRLGPAMHDRDWNLTKSGHDAARVLDESGGGHSSDGGDGGGGGSH